ncbi:hypothetical protein [Streptomyces kronopolitis]
MDSELAALATSGATTLISLMVTDSWTHARELVGRFLSRTGADGATLTDLDAARARLLAARAAAGTHTTDDDLASQWHTYLQGVLQPGSVTAEPLRDLLASLQQLAHAPDTRQITVHNDISGGVQHGPVIQSGRITGLTLHVHQPVDAAQD